MRNRLHGDYLELHSSAGVYYVDEKYLHVKFGSKSSGLVYIGWWWGIACKSSDDQNWGYKLLSVRPYTGSKLNTQSGCGVFCVDEVYLHPQFGVWKSWHVAFIGWWWGLAVSPPDVNRTWSKFGRQVVLHTALYRFYTQRSVWLCMR